MLIAPQLGFYPGYQLQRAEGLGDIVVSPQGKAGYFINFLSLGGEHDNRIGILFPDDPA